MISKNQIKYIKDLSRKSKRNEEKKFVVEGEKLVDELFSSGTGIDEIWATEGWISQHPQVEANQISDKELDRISQLKSPNKVLAIVPMFEDDVNDDLENGLTIFLDNINDPGNLGTIIRMADWFGVNKIVCTPQSVDVYNSKVIQSSMGSAFRIPVFYEDANEYLVQYKKNFPDNPIIGAVMEGEELGTRKMPTNGLLLMGSESHGIDPEIAELMTQTVTIPRMGYAESLNVAVATSIVLWEWRRGALPLKM